MATTVPIENGKQVAILITSVTSILIVAISVGLRLVAKNIGIGFDYSDYCIVAALIWNTALHTCCILLVMYGGFGFYTTEVYQRFGPDTAIFFFKGIMSFALLWNATVCFSKLSVLLVYTTLIPNPSMIQWARVVSALIITWNLSDIVTGFLICRPLAKNWDATLPGTCGSQPTFYLSMGVVNLITDAVIILLPMPYLYRLNMPTRKKILAMALLSIGIGTWVITIYRQTLLPVLDFNDMTHSGVLATILSGLEPAVAIALACIPLMRPLWGRKTTKNKDSCYKYKTSKRSALSLRKGNRSASRGCIDPSTEPVDDNDDSSEIRLNPIKPIQHASVSVIPDGVSDQSLPRPGQTITVERKWEIHRD